MSLRAKSPEGSTSGDVLVVDDDPGVAEATGLMLQEEGLETVTETDPRSALESFDEHISCVVSDYQMPGMNGLELLEELRADYPDVPFILFTGRGSEAIASEAIEAGVNHYLQKGKAEQYERLVNAVKVSIEKFQNERALTKRRRQFETVFENAFDGIFILDMDEGIIVDANPRACELLEYPYDELVGTDIEEIHPDDYEEYLILGRELIDGDSRRRVESTCYTRNREHFASDITAAPMEYEGQTFLLTIMRPRQPEA